ncbi:DoxX family protein [Streptomyces sp. NPDC012637]|uniref:DoxX family protein n=1 Tax=Streptomyces sp. NPDC012637 TaxID=3364842 RepID=UPI0036EFBB5B
MNIALWIVTGLLATAFAAGGALKLIMTKEKIASHGAASAWVEDFTAASIKGIGALEVLGALGLILPAVLDVAPGLVPVAATGLALVMVGAAVVRLRRREFTLVVVDLAYLVLLLFVAWGRFGPESFTG